MATKITYEKAMQELEKIIAEIEDNETPLQELLLKTKKAKELLAYCESALLQLEKTIDKDPENEA